MELTDFRNHPRTRVEDVPNGLIAVVGANGEGKTNLLEGIAFLFFLVSPRASSTEPLVRRGADTAYLRGEIETAGGRVLVEVEIPMTSLWPLKESVLTAYDRTLRQRNRLLKEWEGRGAPKDLEAWDAELVANGSALLRLRADAVARLSPGAQEEFAGLSGTGLACEYRPSVWGEDLEEAFRTRLADRRNDELTRRTSLVGPHRDDLELAVRDLGARAFASHGEAWAAALCLRLGLGSAIQGEVGEPPVLLLDDPFSALDPKRGGQVAERLAGRGQVVVTVADEAHVPPKAEAVWDVSAGAATVRGGG